MKRIVIVGGLIALSLFAVFMTGRKTSVDPISTERRLVGVSSDLMFTFAIDSKNSRFYVANLGDSLSIIGAVFDKADNTVEIRRLELKVLP